MYINTDPNNCQIAFCKNWWKDENVWHDKLFLPTSAFDICKGKYFQHKKFGRIFRCMMSKLSIMRI